MEISTAALVLRAPAPGTFFEVGSLLAALAHVTDQRSARGVRDALAPVLVLMVLAKLSGEDRRERDRALDLFTCLMADEAVRGNRNPHRGG